MHIRKLLFALCAALVMTSHAHTAEPVPTYFTVKINVTNLERSIDFYTKVIGMQVAGKSGGGKIVEILLSRTANLDVAGREGSVILVYNPARTEPLVVGNGFNNITFNYPDLKDVLKRLDAMGIAYTGSAELRPSPTPMAKQIAYAYTKDPDGYTIQLLQRVYATP